MTSVASWTGRRPRVDAVGDSQFGLLLGASGCCCGGSVSCRVEPSRVGRRIQVDLMQRRLVQ